MQELVAPQIINDLELYVSQDTKQAGISGMSLSKMSSIDNSSVSKILSSSTDLTKTRHKAIQSFTGHNVYVDMETTNGAKPIVAEACVCIIEYFAEASLGV